MSDDASDLEEVQRRLNEIQSRKRGDIRWSISRHTAERAIEAIAAPVERTQQEGAKAGRGKSRRRKKNKRLL